MVLEAPAHHSTEVPMVSEAPHNQGPSLPVVSDAPAHPCTKVPMVLEAPPHLRHQGADGVRGSGTSEPPRCWRLLLQKGRDRDDSFIVRYPNSTLGMGRDWDDSFIVGDTFFRPMLSHQPGPKLLIVLEAPAHLSHQGAGGARGPRTSEPPSKATLPQTIPRHIFKSSAKDSTHRSMGITLQGGASDLSAAVAAPTTYALGGQRPLLQVGNRATGACITFSPDSDLEACSHNPAHGRGKTNLSHDGLNPAHVLYWWVNNPTIGEFCFTMIARAGIEGSKSNVAMNAWLPQASYPCGNFSDSSNFKFRRSKGSIGHAFTIRIRTAHLRTPASSFNGCAAPAKLLT
ncbi:hypothetical protein GOBAR_DD19278 [Gossypium barbadense]|nr:hypothetical protein GOBAR_DD19278 [Gossypium barbadense]